MNVKTLNSPKYNFVSDGLPTDVCVVGAELYFLPVRTRMPLKFGAETLTSVTCARACITVRGRDGRTANGWGETPLSIQWAWPSDLSFMQRHDIMTRFCKQLAQAWVEFESSGHALEIGQAFLSDRLPQEQAKLNNSSARALVMPHLAALVCNAAFDLALHDAYGNIHNVPTYATYNHNYLSHDLSTYMTPASDTSVCFTDKYPSDYLTDSPPIELCAWHLVGGLDPVGSEGSGTKMPTDDYPVLLEDWIKVDGLLCLKIKLRGNNRDWDLQRLAQVGKLALELGVKWLTADFNCQVTDPEYVNFVLDRLLSDHPDIYRMIEYVEQPFPYDLEEHRIDVRSISARKPLFMDESAHSWQHVKLGYELGWTGVSLKTCKTQTGAILSLCWAKAHKMGVMVQDLTNPMLAQISHVLLAAHAETIRGVETNAMQFYPDVSGPEARIHPGLYSRRHGKVNISSVYGPGFGYRINEIDRKLPEPVINSGENINN